MMPRFFIGGIGQGVYNLTMRPLIYNLPRNVYRIFSGKNLLWHLLAIVLTWLIVTFGLDWRYYVFFKDSAVRWILFPAVMLGGILPILAPIFLLLIGGIKRSIKMVNTGFAIAQAAIVGLLVSDFYKAFTGRIPPPHFHGGAGASGTLVDISHGFQLGFWRGGVFWGWPSSHTTVAFSVAFALVKLYPENRIVKCLAVLYAFCVGFGVSMSIHWFSEFVAGAIFGSVVGIAIGKSFWERGRET